MSAETDPKFPHRRSEAGTSSPAAGCFDPAEQLDGSRLLDAAKSLSAANDPETLLHSMMVITMENARARRGALILLHDGMPQVEASAEYTRGRIEVQLAGRAHGSFSVPEPALRHTLATGEAIVVDDQRPGAASPGEGPWEDARSRVGICVPISKQARTAGVLYFEGIPAERALSRNLIGLLEFVGAQGVASLENARLYADLKRSEAFLAEGQRLSNTGSWRRIIKTGRLIWSEQTFRIFGLDPQRSTPPDFDDFEKMLHPDDRAEWAKAIRKGISEGSEIAHEFRVIVATGAVKHIYTVGRPLRDESGRVQEVIGTAMDMTERRRKEDELRAAQAELSHVTRRTTMGELAASIAHEVNQPLSAMVTNAVASLMLLSKAPPEIGSAIEAIERIVRDGRQAGEVIKSIRGMLRRSSPVVAMLDMDAIIQEVIALVRAELRQRNISLQVSRPDGPLSLAGDKVLLQQVMINLIKNGIDAMSFDAPGPHVLGIRSFRDAHGVAWVAVDDTGVGLEGGTADRVFEPFYTTKPDGMGLGLSICRSIVESYGGEIRASQRAPRGSTFQFSLPTAVSTAGNDALAAS